MKTENLFSVTDDEFADKVLGADGPVLVDFWAPWCGPCRAVAPVLEELADELSGRLSIAKVNTDEHAMAAGRLGVRGIPTLVLFHEGKEVDRVVGAYPKQALKGWLDDKLPTPSAV